jgi:hypothetical protein
VPYAEVLVGLALAALVWSFGRDIAWLWRNRSDFLTESTPMEGFTHV